jgi:hypothetical protein
VTKGGEGSSMERSRRVIEGHGTIETEEEQGVMSAIEGNPRAIKSRKVLVNRSVAGRVARSQRLSQSHVKVGVHQVVSISSVAQQGAYHRSAHHQDITPSLFPSSSSPYQNVPFCFSISFPPFPFVLDAI